MTIKVFQPGQSVVVPVTGASNMLDLSAPAFQEKGYETMVVCNRTDDLVWYDEALSVAIPADETLTSATAVAPGTFTFRLRGNGQVLSFIGAGTAGDVVLSFGYGF